MQGAILGGYITICDVPSKPIRFTNGNGSVFFEMIKTGTFTKALRCNHPALQLNHKRIIAPYENIKLWEDNLGLRFRAEITDLHTIELAMKGKLTGCSFSFKAVKQSKDTHKGEELRVIEELILYDVSLLSVRPMYRSRIEIESIPHELLMKVEAGIKDRESKPRNAQIMDLYNRVEALKNK